MKKNCKIAIIGGGPGGYVAAIRASQQGYDVDLIEANSLGGVCLNWGCIPSKSLLKSAEIFHLLSKSDEFGVIIEDKCRFDLSKAVKRSRKVVNKLNQGIVHLMKKNNINVINGFAVLCGKFCQNCCNSVVYEKFYQNNLNHKDFELKNLIRSSACDHDILDSSKKLYPDVERDSKFYSTGKDLFEDAEFSKDSLCNLSKSYELKDKGVYCSKNSDPWSKFLRDDCDVMKSYDREAFDKAIDDAIRMKKSEQDHDDVLKYNTSSKFAVYDNKSNLQFASNFDRFVHDFSEIDSNSSDTCDDNLFFDYDKYYRANERRDDVDIICNDAESESRNELWSSLLNDIHYINHENIENDGADLYENSEFLGTGGCISCGSDVSTKNVICVNESFKYYDYIILATGSRARSLNSNYFDNFDEDMIWYAKDALANEESINGLVVMGAGAIGLEFASFFNAIGVNVTVVEMQDQILPSSDKEISNLAKKYFISRGIKIETGLMVKSIADGKVILSDGRELKADKVLVSIGVEPNTQKIGIEHTGINLDNGFIKINNGYETDENGIFAIGDVIGHPCLAHKAMTEAVLCVNQIDEIENSSKSGDVLNIINNNCDHNRDKSANSEFFQNNKIDLPHCYDNCYDNESYAFWLNDDLNGVKDELDFDTKAMHVNRSRFSIRDNRSEIFEKIWQNMEKFGEFDENLSNLNESTIKDDDLRCNVDVEDKELQEFKSIFDMSGVSPKFLNDAMCNVNKNSVNRVDKNHIPMCVYTFPQIASVGLTEEEAIKRGVNIKIGRFNMNANGKALCVDETDGFVKIIIDIDNEVVIGAHMIGSEVTEMITNLTIAIKSEIKMRDLVDMIFPHPTLSEGIFEAIMSANGLPLHF